MAEIKMIPLASLLLNTENYRYDPQITQLDALRIMAQDQGGKLVNLAHDILNKGLNPAELPVVTISSDSPKSFIVLEGNRRIAALKILSSSDLLGSLGLSKGLVTRYKKLQSEGAGNLVSAVNCVVLDKAAADYWILLKHTGENNGVGVVGWDGSARQRFRGGSPAIQAVELVQSHGYLDAATEALLPKLAITNIERVLRTPEARKLIGVGGREQPPCAYRVRRRSAWPSCHPNN